MGISVKIRLWQPVRDGKAGNKPAFDVPAAVRQIFSETTTVLQDISVSAQALAAEHDQDTPVGDLTLTIAEHDQGLRDRDGKAGNKPAFDVPAAVRQIFSETTTVLQDTSLSGQTLTAGHDQDIFVGDLILTTAGHDQDIFAGGLTLTTAEHDQGRRGKDNKDGNKPAFDAPTVRQILNGETVAVHQDTPAGALAQTGGLDQGRRDSKAGNNPVFDIPAAEVRQISRGQASTETAALCMALYVAGMWSEPPKDQCRLSFNGSLTPMLLSAPIALAS